MVKKLGIGCGGLILLLGIIGVVSSGSKPATTIIPTERPAAAETAGTAAKTTPPTAAAPAQAKVGDTVKNGNWSYTVTKVEKVKTLSWSEFSSNTVDALGQWVVVSITLQNIGKQNFSINTFDFQLVDGGGTKYDVSSKVETSLFIKKVKLTTLGEQYPPGIDVKTALIFDVNPAATGLKLVLKQANGTTIALE